jgi:phosphonate transport system permease protein
MLGKVYAEILESVDQAPANALLSSGSSRTFAMLFGLLPMASKELTS